MNFKIRLLKRIREEIRNTKSIKEFEYLSDNLPYCGVTYNASSTSDDVEYIAYREMLKDKIILKEEYDVYCDIFDLIALKRFKNVNPMPEGLNIIDLDPDDDY